LLVPLRDEQGRVLDGVEIEDCGEKLGLEGVDNGRIRFEGVRVPRTALLDRYAKIDEQGDYQSPIENKNRRFFTTIGTLIQGSASSRRSPPASRRPRPGTPRRRSRPAARPAAAPAILRRTASRRSRPTRTCSPPSRATTPCCYSS